MRRKDEFEELDKDQDVRKYLVMAAAGIVVGLVIIGVLIYGQIRGRNDKNPSTETGGQESTQNTESGALSEDTDVDDPQNSNMGEAEGAQVDVQSLLSAGNVAETDTITIGIDVAKYQGTIDWSKVASAGIDFAMIRVGYRTQVDGTICEDTNAKYNMQEAQANGIKIGVYFFSTAVTKEEAVQEADWVAEYISQYQITYPVAYDCEGFGQASSRQNSLSNEDRTNVAIAFMDEIYAKGYTPMFYSAMNELTNETSWDTSRIENTYRVWVAQYPAVGYPETSASSYTGTHAMWQYTNQGTIPGISKKVDVNVAYFGYEGSADAQNQNAPDNATADVEALMKFKDVNETVTSKDTTNLRDKPSQGTDSTVVTILNNGDTATRTGVSDSGWSRVVYNGTTYYAVSNYLTTDLSYKPSSGSGDGTVDGIKTKFTECSEQITPKIQVNLRSLPSVTDPNSTVVATIDNGVVVTRTGYNEEYGWSRVEYNGQTLYCVSSYMTAAQ